MYLINLPKIEMKKDEKLNIYCNLLNSKNIILKNQYSIKHGLCNVRYIHDCTQKKLIMILFYFNVNEHVSNFGPLHIEIS
jgi:hypothetical protein